MIHVRKDVESINKVLSDKAGVLGPTSPSSRRCATNALLILGDLSLVCSEIRGEICREMGMTRKWALNPRQWRLRARRGDEECVQRQCRCVVEWRAQKLSRGRKWPNPRPVRVHTLQHHRQSRGERHQKHHLQGQEDMH